VSSGVALGLFDTEPANVVSYDGSENPSYALGTDPSSNRNSLQSYILSLLAAKPINYVSSYTETVSGRTMNLESSTSPTGIHVVQLLPGENNLEVNEIIIGAGDASVFVVVDTQGNLQDVTLNTDFNPLDNAYVVVIARNIYIAPSVTVANAAFIASERFSTGAGGNTLKIRGNVVALAGIEQQRTRTDADHARPSVLMVYDPKYLIGTMQHLNINTIEYKIIR